MSQRLSRSSSSTHLEPPQKGTELEDPRAHESGSENDHFSDATEGQRSVSRPSSRHTSPVPRTRIERVDNEPSYGEIPGTAAYRNREKDSVPDEIEVIPEGLRSKRASNRDLPERPLTVSGTPIPLTLVEKVDPGSPSYGDLPGTHAYEMRKADAVPDLVLKAPDPDGRSPSIERWPQESSPNFGPVPETRLSRIDSLPNKDMSTSPRAHRRCPSDALPDAIETVQNAPGYGDNGKDENISGNDFDDFEAGEHSTGDDDFGDFDDAFQEPTGSAVVSDTVDPSSVTLQQPPTLLSFPSLLDFNSLTSLSDLMTKIDNDLETLFPNTKGVSSLPPVEPIPDSSAIFNTERSLSLWSQLVAPPPLLPPNWVKSRIRRLFLVSLGVPVDLDEILPASKQKKLVLPSIDLDSPRAFSHELSRSLSRFGKKDGPQNTSPTSVHSTGSTFQQRPARRRGPPPPPELDLLAVWRLCATTEAALDGFTDIELRSHIQALEESTGRASEVLEYWLKRREGLVGEKEAFEGVIENLVNHARRVRK